MNTRGLRRTRRNGLLGDPERIDHPEIPPDQERLAPRTGVCDVDHPRIVSSRPVAREKKAIGARQPAEDPVVRRMLDHAGLLQAVDREGEDVVLGVVLLLREVDVEEAAVVRERHAPRRRLGRSFLLEDPQRAVVGGDQADAPARVEVLHEADGDRPAVGGPGRGEHQLVHPGIEDPVVGSVDADDAQLHGVVWLIQL